MRVRVRVRVRVTATVTVRVRVGVRVRVRVRNLRRVQPGEEVEEEEGEVQRVEHVVFLAAQPLDRGNRDYE